MENSKDKNSELTRKRRRRRNIAIVATVVVLAGVGIYIYFSRRKNEDDTVPYIPPITTTALTQPSTYIPSTPSRNDNFPLKRGSRGERVKQLQLALIAKYGASALPKYGADSDFGSEVESALTKNGWPTSIDETTYNVLVSAITTPIVTFSPKTIAKELYNACKNKSFSSALTQLKKIGSVSEYSDVNTEFKALELNGVATTIVTGLLKTFTQTTQKDQLKQQFIRMGLKYDSTTDKWSLSGLGGRNMIITVNDTVVWAKPNLRIPVTANTVLGEALHSAKGYTMFQTLDGRHLLVKSTSVRFYEKD